MISYTLRKMPDKSVMVTFKKETMQIFQNSGAWAVSTFIEAVISSISKLKGVKVFVNFEQMAELNATKLQDINKTINSTSFHEYLVMKWLKDGVRIADAEKFEDCFAALQLFEDRFLSECNDNQD